MLWCWLLVPLLPWLLREPGGAARMPRRVLAGRLACGLAWYAGAHGALLALGEAAACVIYHDPLALALRAGSAVLHVLLVAAVAWAWQRRTPRRRDGLLAGVAVVVLAAATLTITPRWWSPEPARFGRVLAMPAGASLVEHMPNRPAVRYEINDRGFRGPGWSDAAPAGTARGVLIGDSFVFGSGVELPDTLAESLRRVLAERAPRQAYEILNLGIGGDNLPSHVDVYEEAVRSLHPSFVVLCLTLPNDMSAYDDQVLRREERRIGGYTLAKWAFGPWLATWMWSAGRVAVDVTPGALAVLDREIGRLALARAAGPAPPLLVLTYRAPDPRVLPALLRIPGALLVPSPPEDPSFYLPIDGHPTGAGNRVFAARIADTLREVPALAAPFARP